MSEQQLRDWYSAGNGINVLCASFMPNPQATEFHGIYTDDSSNCQKTRQIHRLAAAM
jgi:hypothetical protein